MGRVGSFNDDDDYGDDDGGDDEHRSWTSRSERRGEARRLGPKLGVTHGFAVMGNMVDERRGRRKLY